MNKLMVMVPLTALLFAAIGCDPAPKEEENTAPTSSTTPTTQNEPEPPAKKEIVGAKILEDGTISVADVQPKDGDEVAILETGEGKIVLMFFPEVAPKHVENFKKLVSSGFYDGTKFHRIQSGFMIQGGDPNTKNDDRSTWGMGGPDTRVPAEFNDIHHEPGVLSMARGDDPNSAGSQFFIVHGDAGFLDRNYTAFGKVVSGMDVVNKIVSGEVTGPKNDQAVNPVVLKNAKMAKWPVK